MIKQSKGHERRAKAPPPEQQQLDDRGREVQEPIGGKRDPKELAAIERACDATRRAFDVLPASLMLSAPVLSPGDANFTSALFHEENPDFFLDKCLLVASMCSNRGIPRSIFETHLRTLSKELQKNASSDPLWCQRLEWAAAEMRIEREELLPEARREALVANHLSRVPRSEAHRKRARMVTAAVADEANGMGSALEALLALFEETESFEALRDLALDTRREILALKERRATTV